MNSYRLKHEFYSTLDKVLMRHERTIVNYDEEMNKSEVFIEFLPNRIMIESVEIMNELGRLLRLPVLEVYSSNDIIEKYEKFWKFLGCYVYEDNENGIRFLVEGKCLAKVERDVLHLYGENIINSKCFEKNDNSNFSTKRRYFIISKETDMLYERFKVANIIRNNGIDAYYDIDDKTIEQLQLDGNGWIIISFDRCLYEKGRCNVKYDGEDFLGEVYINNVGKKSYS